MTLTVGLTEPLANLQMTPSYQTQLYSMCMYVISGLHFWSVAEQEQVWAICADPVCAIAMCVYAWANNSTNFCLCWPVLLALLAAGMYVCVCASVHVSIGNMSSGYWFCSLPIQTSTTILIKLVWCSFYTYS